jgi:hypothetical protein
MHYRHTGVLTEKDAKRHLPHPFSVPTGASRVALDLRFEPARVIGINNLLSLTLFDPNGFRGSGHRGGNHHTVEIAAGAATPGYLPGVLPAGEWIAEIDTHMVMPGEPCTYTLEVWADEGSSAASATSATTQAVSTPESYARGFGWYRGDLHSHTDHSDADRSVAQLLEAARNVALDFIFLTDHNTTSGLPECDRSATPNLATMGGLELTTFWGHALCLGTRQWIDWRVRPHDGSMPAVARAVDGQGYIYIIAHPCSAGDPACTGCRWVYPHMMPGPAQRVEVWNGPWSGDSNNEDALALWYGWLNQGYHLHATAGSDTHSNADYAAEPGFSVVYAPELSQAGILAGLRAGHLYLSAGPLLSLEGNTPGGQNVMMGDTANAGVIELSVGWSACPADATLIVIEDGRPVQRWQTVADGAHSWRNRAGARWTLVEVRHADGRMLALTNPIWLQG